MILKIFTVKELTKITVEDISIQSNGNNDQAAASSRRYAGNRLHAIVAPCMFIRNIRFIMLMSVFNAIFVHGNVGDAMFYGSRSRKTSTASAVVADVVDEAKASEP